MTEAEALRFMEPDEYIEFEKAAEHKHEYINGLITAMEAVAKGQVTALSFRTGIVRNPSGRDSHLSGHSPPCGVDPVQSMYRMTAESAVVSLWSFPKLFSTSLRMCGENWTHEDLL